MEFVVRRTWLRHRVVLNDEPVSVDVVGGQLSAVQARRMAEALAALFPRHRYDGGRDCWIAESDDGSVVTFAVGQGHADGRQYGRDGPAPDHVAGGRSSGAE